MKVAKNKRAGTFSVCFQRGTWNAGRQKIGGSVDDETGVMAINGCLLSLNPSQKFHKSSGNLGFTAAGSLAIRKDGGRELTLM
jgi:hypothetical protein